MASYYLDSSAFLKLYIQEEGSSRMVSLAQGEDRHQIVILDIALVESRSALRRKQRAGEISLAEADSLLSRIHGDAESQYRVETSTPEMLRDAARLIDSHPLRTYDAVQLAGCLAVRSSVHLPLAFVCADFRLCAAAGSEGLTVFNPLEGS
jgi:predicted nucleic acid-binding protein